MLEIRKSSNATARYYRKSEGYQVFSHYTDFYFHIVGGHDPSSSITALEKTVSSPLSLHTLLAI